MSATELGIDFVFRISQAAAMGQFLDHKLDCKTCGTIYMDIPEHVSNDTPISCSTCGGLLGRWGDLVADFESQSRGTHIFDLKYGKIEAK